MVRSDSPEYEPEIDPDNPFEDVDDRQRQYVERLREEVDLFGRDSDEDVEMLENFPGIISLLPLWTTFLSPVDFSPEEVFPRTLVASAWRLLI